MLELMLTQEWDKTFPQSDKVNHSKITFRNRYGITLAADMYVPKDATEPFAAIAVSGPLAQSRNSALASMPRLSPSAASLP